MDNSFTTIIVHEIRKKLQLSCNEYCVVDLIDWSADETGWCEVTRQEMAEKLGLSKQAIVKILDGLLKAGIIQKHDDTKKLCATALWKDYFIDHQGNFVDRSLLDTEKKQANFIEPWQPAKPITPFTTN